jgi:excinuclease ABC subunit C
VLSHKFTFSADYDDTFFQELPAAAAVFLLRGDGEPYVSKTANLRRRLQRLIGPPTEHSKRLNLRDRVREIQFTLTGSEFESQFLLYRVLREAFPKTYAKRMRLRPAPLVKLHLENQYPRASITTRLSRHGSNLFYGPFRSRAAAEKFASDALDFFKMRRCVEDLHPDPAFPGCVYSEMKMCLAPCFKGCTDAEYHAEIVRVQTFFDTAGQSLTRELTEQRERASAELAFEDAAAVHAKLDKLKPVLTQLPEIVRRIDRLQAIILQPGAEPGRVVLFKFCGAAFAGPVMFNIELRAESRSMEAEVEEIIRDFPAPPAKSSVERMEHLAILKRWYFRSSRGGEIFFADDRGLLPLRRIVCGIRRVYRGEKELEPESFSATPNQITPS